MNTMDDKIKYSGLDRKYDSKDEPPPEYGSEGGSTDGRLRPSQEAILLSDGDHNLGESQQPSARPARPRRFRVPLSNAVLSSLTRASTVLHSLSFDPTSPWGASVISY